MKFLLATGIFPPEIGGPATVMALLAQNLRQRGHEVTVVTYGENPSSDGVIRVSRRGNVVSRYVRYCRTVRSLLKQDTTILAVDVFSVGIPVRAALIRRKNTLLMRLGGEWCWEDAVTKGRTRLPLREFWKQYHLGARAWAMKWNYRWILHRATRIFVTSDLLTDVLMRIAPAVSVKVVTVPNIVNDVKMPVAARTAHAPLRLIYVGRFAPVKNVPFFARVLKRAVEQGIPVTCRFIGDGPDMGQVRSILSQVPGMEFSGSLTQQEVVRAFADADVLAIPSLTDICPNAVVEALSLGVPCMMTKEHGLPGPLSGVIEVDPRDEDVWLDELRRLTSADEFEKRAKSVRPVLWSGPSLIDVVCPAQSRDRSVLLIGYGMDLLQESLPAFARVASLARDGFCIQSLILSKSPVDTGVRRGGYGAMSFSGGAFCRMWRVWRTGCAMMKDAQGRGLISAQDPFVAGVIGWMIARATRLPLEVQEHGDFFSGSWVRESPSHRAWVWIGSRILRSASRVRVVSERVAEHVSNIGVPRDKIVVIPVAMDLQSLQGLSQRQSTTLYRLVVPCRFVRQKGLDVVLDAVVRLKKLRADFSVALIGRGPLETELREQIAGLQLTECVSIEDWKPMEMIWKDADLFILASRYEGFGRTIVEAMAAGVAIVTTDVGCVGSIFRPNEDGLVVACDDAEALAQAIDRQLSDVESRDRMRAHARRSAATFPDRQSLQSAQRDAWRSMISPV
jgi:glycosyltransferase involved in cell wall biosynthesis